MIITIQIPIGAYKKHGVDRELFLEAIKRHAIGFIPEADVTIIKGVGGK